MPLKTALALMLLLSTAACSVTKTIPVETIREVYLHDTLVIRDYQFDSTYVSHERLEKDTLLISPSGGDREGVLIRETYTQYRYRILRDTILDVKRETIRDSIPYPVTVTQVKEVPRPLTWFDRLSRLSLIIVIAAVVTVAMKTGFIRARAI